MDGNKLEIEGKIYTLTAHATHRARNRGITLDDIKEALVNYKTIRRSLKRGKEDSYRVTGRNNIVIVLNKEKTVIITVLKRNKNYSNSKTKAKRNKRQLEFKRLYGNRARK